MEKKGIDIIDPITKKVVDVEETDEETESDPDDSKDSDYDSLDDHFGSLSDEDDDSMFCSDDVDSNVERDMVASRAKVKGKGVVSPKKRKKVLSKKPLSKVTGKRKRSTKVGDKGPGPSPKLAKIWGTPGSSAKETAP